MPKKILHKVRQAKKNQVIPAKEKWLHDNKAALKQVKKGLQDAAQGRVKSRGSLSK